VRGEGEDDADEQGDERDNREAVIARLLKLFEDALPFVGPRERLDERLCRQIRESPQERKEIQNVVSGC